jgi:putative oxidoreductase
MLKITMASLFGVAGVLETVGGTLLLLGLFTRPVAWVFLSAVGPGLWSLDALRGTRGA